MTSSGAREPPPRRSKINPKNDLLTICSQFMQKKLAFSKSFVEICDGVFYNTVNKYKNANYTYEGKVLHMIRKSKINQSKQGIILVMVLLIVAMAMIFISAALLLTNSTRSRLYNNAEESQARLTVTSASEAMYQAIEMQEINDQTIEALAAGSGSTLTLKVSDGTVAGMGTDADNCTKVHVYEINKVEPDDEGEEAVFKYIYMDFTTTIGDKSENVRMILKGPGPDKKVNLFSTVMDLAGASGDQNLAQFNIGEGGSGKKDNVVVVRGSGQKYVIDRANQNIYSTHIFVGEKSSESIDVWLRDSTYYGDLVFYGDYATLHWDLQPKIKGNVYFLGKTSGGAKNAFTGVDGTSRTFGENGSSWVFVNRTANGDTDRVENMLKNKTCVLLLDSTNNSGTSVSWDNGNASGISAGQVSTWKTKYDAGGTSISKLKTNIKNYMSSTFTGDGAYPTTSKALGALASNAGSTQYTSSQFLNNFAYSATNKTCLAGGTYRLYDGNSGTYHMNNSNKGNQGECKYVFLDGADSTGYNIYLGSDYDMTGVCFVLLNGSKTTKCNFILEKNVDLSLGYCNYSNNDHYATGFVSVSANGCADPESAYNTLGGTTISSRTSGLYDGSAKPHIFIYGVGGTNGNHVTFGNSGGAKVVVEAYCGLFEDSYPGKSVLQFSNQPVYFYGRIQAPKFIADTNSNNSHIYYCPDPNADEDDGPTIAKTKYKVYDVIYYYDVA